MLARSLFAVVAPVALVLATNADALPHQFHRHEAPQFRRYEASQFHRYEASHHIAAANHARANSLAHAAAPSRSLAGSDVQIVAHPVGCPRTLFCGCGAARELGLSDPSLWAVKAWYQFPRAAAAPGMALLWGERHVAAIRAVHDDGTVTVYDANSGGGLTRIHRISLAGLIVVDPHAGHHGQPTFASFPPTARQQLSSSRSPDNPAVPKIAAYNDVASRFGSRAHSVIPPSPDSCSVARLYRPVATSTTAASMVEKRL
jgi:hypothetical protein